MTGVPFTFATATTAIPLSELDVCFATQITIGSTQVGLGNATPNLTGLTNVASVTGQFSNGVIIGNLTNQMTTYEVGLWTPTDASGGGLSFPTALGRYIKTGQSVQFSGTITFPATADTNVVTFGGLPYTASNAIANSFDGAFFNFTNTNRTDSLVVNRNAKTLVVYGNSGNQPTNAIYSAKTVSFTGWYQSAT